MNKALRWVGYGLGGLLGLVLVALSAAYGVSEYRLHKQYDVPVSAFTVPEDPATIARGQHVATIRGCVDCHTANFAGMKFIDDPMLGTIYSANLTRGKGGTADWTAADWSRAIRNGVRRDGKPLLIMPSHEYQTLGDEDVAAMIAYFRSLPPVDTEDAPNRVRPLGRVLHATGAAPLAPAELIDHAAPRPPAPPPGPTREYGRYMAASCTGCHGEGFSGGKIPGDPSGMIPANITPDVETGIGRWTEADFVRALRTGKRPDGTELKPQMPWKLTAQMTDEEIHATWLYLRSVPARKHGNR